MKKYLVLNHFGDPEDKTNALDESAKAYYGTKDWEYVAVDPKFSEAFEALLECSKAFECNVELYILSMTLMLLSQVNSVYFPHDWEQDDCLKFCQLMAFRYGIDIVYESV